MGKCYLEIDEMKQASDCLELALKLLADQQDEIKKRKRAIFIGKELMKRQKQKQYEIENFIYHSKKDEERNRERPDPEEEYDITFDEDATIAGTIDTVKNLLLKVLDSSPQFSEHQKPGDIINAC